jgi:hypothetical protein
MQNCFSLVGEQLRGVAKKVELFEFALHFVNGIREHRKQNYLEEWPSLVTFFDASAVLLSGAVDSPRLLC